ncbi:response regulator [Desulfosarcina sp.]|uniref:response regulator n=1 Tax=Desulfosarcina sp. TaxID=2027861 RepID=UPI0029AC4478|nr:response regulator [Desulfosarcina sp.]MDX2452368.1 response regulator [Desulfosarcina sp.]MDX2490148.1 response regulator [Desulfosarcina sp.]
MTISKASILVVDDDDLIRDVVCLMLSTLGYATIAAQDGIEALVCMKNNDSIHLVLTDINIPQMDGWELARHIKALKPEVPIVAFTGDSPDVILPRLPDSEINQALFKPLRIEVLRGEISTILPSEGIKYAS